MRRARSHRRRHDREPAYEIKQLSGSPRQWAETMILLRLEHGDARVSDALVRLGAEWTVPRVR